MSYSKYFLSLVFFTNTAFAEKGYVYEADFNGDGVEDSLKSGPTELFGNGGGDFLLRVSMADGSFSEKVIGLHPKAVVFEENGSKSKIWSYWRMSVSEGVLSYTILDGSFESKSLDLYFNSDSTELSKEIYSLIFDENKIVNFKEVQDYTPPEYPWGK